MPAIPKARAKLFAPPSYGASILAPWLTHTGFNSIGYLGSRLEGLLTK